MISFEFSITNLVITAAILLLAVLYITILLKLKPSTEKKDPHKKDSLAEKRKPPQNGLIFVNSLKTKEETAPPQRTQTQTNPHKIQHSLTKTAHTSVPQDKNQEASKPVVKPENRPSNLQCAHHFGYLRTLPKSTSIPSECLGCLQVVDCMTTLKVERKLVKSHVTKS